MLICNVSKIFFFCVTAVDSLPRLDKFSPCNPLIFCFLPTLYAHSLLKNDFFSNVHGKFLREDQRKGKFQAEEVPSKETKRYFFALF